MEFNMKKDKKGSTIWVTKWWQTAGVIVMHDMQISKSELGSRAVWIPNEILISTGTYDAVDIENSEYGGIYIYNSDFHFSIDAAVIQVESLRRKKISKWQKKITKLNKKITKLKAMPIDFH